MRTIKITDTNGYDYIIPENQIAFIKHEDSEYRQVYSLKLQCGSIIFVDYDNYEEVERFLTSNYNLDLMPRKQWNSDYKQALKKYIDSVKQTENNLITRLSNIEYKIYRALNPNEEEIHIEDNPILKEPIEELDLSVRSYNCLKRADIQTIGDLVSKTEDDIIIIKNLGRRSLKEIKEKLLERDLCFKDESFE